MSISRRLNILNIQNRARHFQLRLNHVLILLMILDQTTLGQFYQSFYCTITVIDIVTITLTITVIDIVTITAVMVIRYCYRSV